MLGVVAFRPARFWKPGRSLWLLGSDSRWYLDVFLVEWYVIVGHWLEINLARRVPWQEKF
jgi:hypothetical protein